MLSFRLFFKSNRPTKKSNGFLFLVTSNLLIPAATNVRFAPIDRRGADLLFQIVTAMIDRLVHHGEVTVIHGSSFRMKDSTPDQ